MSGTTFSNSLATLSALAARAKKHYSNHLVEWMTCAATLQEARTICPHGQWLPFLKEAGVPKSTAHRMITIAESGLQMSHVGHFGGIAATLYFLSHDRGKVDRMVEVMDRIAELDARIFELDGAIDNRDERLAIMYESATPEQREWIDRGLEQLATITANKRWINELLAEVQIGKRENAAIKRKIVAMDKRTADVDSAIKLIVEAETGESRIIALESGRKLLAQTEQSA